MLKRGEIIRLMTSASLSDGFVSSRVKRWRELASTEARVGYLLMFAKTNFADLVKGFTTPILILAGAKDRPIDRAEVMHETFGQYYPNCNIEEVKIRPLCNEEAPPFLVTRIEKFLKKNLVI